MCIFIAKYNICYRKLLVQSEKISLKHRRLGERVKLNQFIETSVKVNQRVNTLDIVFERFV